MACADCKKKGARIKALEKRLAWATNPSQVMRDEGHIEECVQVQAPNASHPCDCEKFKARDAEERELLENNQCVMYLGHWPNRTYCAKALVKDFWRASKPPKEERLCKSCAVRFTEESFAARGATMNPVAELKAGDTA